MYMYIYIFFFPLIAEILVHFSIHFLLFIAENIDMHWDIHGGILCDLINFSWILESRVYSLWSIKFKIYSLNEPH
jgi:hypothetical protein